MQMHTRRSWLHGLGWAGIGSVLAPAVGAAQRPAEAPSAPGHELDRWLDPLTAPIRQLVDVVQPVETAGFNYALTFLYANRELYKRQDADVNVVVVLRDKAATLALGDALWEKYQIGAFVGVADPATKAPAIRNIHARRTPTANAALSAAIDALQDRGVVVAACGTALRSHAGGAARRAGLDPAAARDEWATGVLPRVVVVPAGIIAVQAAQQRGFAYAAAGG